MTVRRLPLLALLLFCQVARSSAAEQPDFVSYDEPVIAVRHAWLIDGTGRPALAGQTLLIENGIITALGPDADIAVPDQARVLDARGKTLIPGLVLLHEHMFYPVGQRGYNEMLHSFPLLYLAGGVTTLRTAGSMSTYGDLNLREAIDQGKTPGPDMDVTTPFLNGPGLPILKVRALRDVADARRMVEYWAGEGATSYKAYTDISREQLAEVIRQAHLRKQKVTGHLCSVTYREAAALGIDNLEHGFFTATDFVPDKAADTCPSNEAIKRSLLALDPDSAEAAELIQFLVDKDVTVTSTLTVFETFARGRPRVYPEALALLSPPVREEYERGYAKVNTEEDDSGAQLLRKGMALERRFVAAGGRLVVGTDPTGFGGVIPGFSSKRVIELLVDAGFDLEQVIRFATLEGARYLGREQRIGSLEVGKRADFSIIDGELAADPAAIRRMPVVFKAGTGFNTQPIFEAMAGRVGLQ